MPTLGDHKLDSNYWNWMIRKITRVFRDEIQIIVTFHHQLNINQPWRYYLLIYQVFCFVGLFTLVKDKLNTLNFVF
jgi:hypothetical protein